ncbi:uncharacterized protein GGS25DRAFT_522106 [Hypoxylon fragiforme]|uniref:uncharacterized protein n=1 Tax=Hypoxylon fragiforme TaxID=63214 RepID=UPI0020C6982C|nr:uncharacterized protein GGS25DRAFT_522106 [Hypoxylon fragiforme]KAI2608927.1 hypothetical protein GGS25DRAFT_522106 [Hypoxylon fragiforme]
MTPSTCGFGPYIDKAPARGSLDPSTSSSSPYYSRFLQEQSRLSYQTQPTQENSSPGSNHHLFNTGLGGPSSAVAAVPKPDTKPSDLPHDLRPTSAIDPAADNWEILSKTGHEIDSSNTEKESCHEAEEKKERGSDMALTMTPTNIPPLPGFGSERTTMPWQSAPLRLIPQSASSGGTLFNPQAPPTTTTQPQMQPPQPYNHWSGPFAAAAPYSHWPGATPTPTAPPQPQPVPAQPEASSSNSQRPSTVLQQAAAETATRLASLEKQQQQQQEKARAPPTLTPSEEKIQQIETAMLTSNDRAALDLLRDLVARHEAWVARSNKQLSEWGARDEERLARGEAAVAELKKLRQRDLRRQRKAARKQGEQHARLESQCRKLCKSIEAREWEWEAEAEDLGEQMAKLRVRGGKVRKQIDVLKEKAVASEAKIGVLRGALAVVLDRVGIDRAGNEEEREQEQEQEQEQFHAAADEEEYDAPSLPDWLPCDLPDEDEDAYDPNDPYP